MYSKPSISQLAKLSNKINITEDIVIIPRRAEVPNGVKIQEAVNNLIEKHLHPNYKEIDNLVNNFVDEFEDPSQEKAVNSVMEAPVHDETIVAVPIEDPDIETALMQVAAPKPEEEVTKEQTIFNDVEMLDQDHLTEQSLSVIDRDITLDEIKSTRQEIEEKLDLYLRKSSNCRKILDVLNIREQSTRNYYEADSKTTFI